MGEYKTLSLQGAERNSQWIMIKCEKFVSARHWDSISILQTLLLILPCRLIHIPLLLRTYSRVVAILDSAAVAAFFVLLELCFATSSNRFTSLLFTLLHFTSHFLTCHLQHSWRKRGDRVGVLQRYTFFRMSVSTFWWLGHRLSSPHAKMILFHLHGE